MAPGSVSVNLYFKQTYQTMEEKKELSLNLPEDLLIPKGDAMLIKLKEHVKHGGTVRVHIKDKEDQIVTTEDELFEITAPFVNQ